MRYEKLKAIGRVVYMRPTCAPLASSSLLTLHTQHRTHHSLLCTHSTAHNSNSFTTCLLSPLLCRTVPLHIINPDGESMISPGAPCSIPLGGWQMATEEEVRLFESQQQQQPSERGGVVGGSPGSRRPGSVAPGLPPAAEDTVRPTPTVQEVLDEESQSGVELAVTSRPVSRER